MSRLDPGGFDAGSTGQGPGKPLLAVLLVLTVSGLGWAAYARVTSSPDQSLQVQQASTTSPAMPSSTLQPGTTVQSAPVASTSVASELPTATTAPAPSGPWLTATAPNLAAGGGWSSEGIQAVECLSDSDCLAVGYSYASNAEPPSGIILRSGDGGAAWAVVSTGPANTAYVSIECVDATTCVVGGADKARSLIMRTEDAGLNWSNVELPEGPGQTITSISCATADRCMAVRPINPNLSQVLASKDAGHSWTVVEFDEPAGPFAAAVDCLPDGGCVLTVGHYSVGPSAISITDDLGETWKPVAVPTDLHWLGQMSCVSSTSCLALGVGYTFDPVPSTTKAGEPTPPPHLSMFKAAFRTQDGGRTWERVGAGPTQTTYVMDLACISTDQCFSALSNLSTVGQIQRTIDGGRTWEVVQDVPTGILNGLSCSTNGRCITVGGGELNGTRPPLVLVKPSA